MSAAFRRIRILLAGVLFAVSTAAAALVTAQGNTWCKFMSVPDVIDFGPYTGQSQDVAFTISYQCDSASKEIYIVLDAGPDRVMQGPRPSTASGVGYELYRRDLQGALSVWTANVSKTTAYYLKDPKDRVTQTVDGIARVSTYSVPVGSYTDDLAIRMYWLPNGGTEQELSAPVVVKVGGGGAVTTCTVATTDLAFGNYDPLIVNGSGTGSDLDGQGTITVTCSGAAGPLVWIAPGTAGRVMTGPGNLTYELYSDAARTAVWGSTAGTAFPVSLSGGSSQTVPVFGRIPRGQNVAVGGYAQTVTVTVNF